MRYIFIVFVLIFIIGGKYLPSLRPGLLPVLRYPLLGVPGVTYAARFIGSPHPALSQRAREKI